MTDRLKALERLRELLSLFHVANDADDHWSGAEATQIRHRAVSGIRELLREQPFLAALYPTLEKELETVHQRDISWSLWVALEREIQAERAALPDSPES